MKRRLRNPTCCEESPRSAVGIRTVSFKVGGSVFGMTSQAQAANPATLRTVVPTSGNAILGVPFLGFNDNVQMRGLTTFWDLHMAWFYQQWAVIGEWGSGFQDYALSSTPTNRTSIPVQSFHVQASYLLTGETRSSVGIVKPRNPIRLEGTHFRGLGAIEPYFRYEFLDISSKVFSSGFADPNLWANRVWGTWVGVNWHLTQYIKMYFDWNHSEFGAPVLFAPGRRQLAGDMFMARLQIYF
jgi:phosphate-selective porin OprO/OprP